MTSWHGNASVRAFDEGNPPVAEAEFWCCMCVLTHSGRVTHICVSTLTIIGSDNGLSPGRRQAIIWTKTGILLIGPLGTNFSQTLIEIHKFSFKKMRLKVSSAKWRPCCLGLNVLTWNAVERTVEISVIWGTSALIWRQWYLVKKRGYLRGRCDLLSAGNSLWRRIMKII